jgi:indolepyruvate ferredoxin oxidoreductase alpha subunit
VSAYPFPQTLATEFLQGLDEVLVVEELDPVIEYELLKLCGRHGLRTTIKGKLTGEIPNAGENSPDSVAAAVTAFLQTEPKRTKEECAEYVMPTLPVRPPVLCAGCPHRASFLAVKEIAKNGVFSGDIGCYTLGNALPLDMVDTCLCMGAGITVAQGLQRVEPDKPHFAFIGDSTFFHTGIPGLINAVYNQTDIIVVILDNSTTAMTGSQPHPGTGVTMMGNKSAPVSIAKLAEAIGVTDLVRADPLSHADAKAAVARVLPQSGVRVILFESPCIALVKGRSPCAVDAETCRGCKICVGKLGCPALTMADGKAVINETLCTGCRLCAQVCPFNAIDTNGVSGGAE